MFTSSINVEALQSLVSGKDVVCGKELQASSAAATLNHEGKVFYFCSEECKNTFEAEPEKFAAAA
jgi:YHS domain-containing protein